MRIKLHNILKIESADIEIGGLTVLTGENNSGKSTIGKILFSVLKAVNNVRQIDRIKTVSLIRRELFSIRRMSHFNGHGVLMLKDIQGLSVSLADRSLPFDLFANELERELFANADYSTRMTAMLRNRLGKIRQYIVGLENPEIAMKSEFELISKSEFMEPINSYGTNNSAIHFHDDTTDAGGSDVNIEITDGKISNIYLLGNPSIEDITYVESPLYMHILNALRMYSPIPTASLQGIAGLLHKENIPFHLADMAEKMLSPSEEYIELLNVEWDTLRPLLQMMNSVMGGEFVVDAKTRQLSFKQNGRIVPPISVASGIKSFGVLQRLIQTNNVSTFKMLVWDEPEIHLHPEWQVVFCELIVDLVANGVPIVVSSHSPYFIQGLRYFAAAKGIERDVKYYMAEESDITGLSSIKEVTGDLNNVFTLLAAPLREIMNVDAIRNKMK